MLPERPFTSAFPDRRGLMRRVALALRVIALLVSLPAATAFAGIGPTVKEVIEFTRIIQPAALDDETLQTQISPDGGQAFIVTRKADVATDVNRFDILLLDLNPKSLAAGRPGAPVVLLTVEASNDHSDAQPALQDVRWFNERTLVFKARMNDAPEQAYRIDVLTRRITQLTFAPLGLVSFDLSADQRRVVYLAPSPNPALQPGARSVVVGTQSFWSIHFGQDDFRKQQRRYQYFVTEAGARSAARAMGDSFAEASLGFPSASISPDGQWLLLPRYEPERQLAWAKDYPYIAETMDRFGPSLKIDPLSYFSRPSSYVPRRMLAYRLSDGLARPVVDAPDDSMQDNQRRTDRLWQDGGRSVVIAGTFLPVGQGRAAEGRSHVIEYWPESGRWEVVAVLEKRAKAAYPMAGKYGAFIVVDGDRRRPFVKDAGGKWLEIVEEPSDAPNRTLEVGWRLRVQQALNQPPDIVAVGAGGAVVRLTHLNPQFVAAQWGSMREYGWKDSRGRDWKGGLMVPADFDATKRHALVIQAYGFSPTRFYRDGSNMYDGFTSGFPGRAFLRENILVLAFPLGPSTGAATDERGRRVAFAEGVQGAIDQLVLQGLVDRDRVGIMGWSATGESVLNLVTFSNAPIRAASLLDGDANTVFSLAITYAFVDGNLVHKERANEGGPYGESRDRWVANDPSLNTHCIRAAMRIETYGKEVHNNWDVYALLRRQYRPAEMIVIPEGGHALARPSERMISLQGNLDWHRFWLNREERSEPTLPSETSDSLRQQYTRWQQMLPLKQAADSKAACSSAFR
jgi:dipeptidyl aminopeptidase/acylaminoacyl peptidase